MHKREPKSGKIKLDAKFAARLQSAIASGQFVLGKHKTGDWLKTLTDKELSELITMAERCAADADAADHLCTVILTLSALESGKSISTVDASNLDLLLPIFLKVLNLERARRQGLILLTDSLTLTDHRWQIEITAAGKPEEDMIKQLIES
jgi:hypothetical protein